MPMSSFQRRVGAEVLDCFGPEIFNDLDERNRRFLEEALELVQACGLHHFQASQLVDYVYRRPVGKRTQEVGGVMVTLAALCDAQGVDMVGCAETELDRFIANKKKILAKHMAKPKDVRGANS